MSDVNIEPLSRGELLKKLRKEHADSVERTQVVFRDQRQMQQAICKFIEDTPRSIPEIAVEIGKSPNEVLWFVSALKKYGIVYEDGMSGDYPLYQLVKEAQK